MYVAFVSITVYLLIALSTGVTLYVFDRKHTKQPVRSAVRGAFTWPLLFFFLIIMYLVDLSKKSNTTEQKL